MQHDACLAVAGQTVTWYFARAVARYVRAQTHVDRAFTAPRVGEDQVVEHAQDLGLVLQALARPLEASREEICQPTRILVFWFEGGHSHVWMQMHAHRDVRLETSGRRQAQVAQPLLGLATEHGGRQLSAQSR